MPATTSITALTDRPMSASPAANLPLITSSRWIGCERRRGRVPCARSPLMASKPKAMPSSGASSDTSPTNDGTGSAPMVKRARNTADAPLACSAASRIVPDAAYTGAIAARPRMAEQDDEAEAGQRLGQLLRRHDPPAATAASQPGRGRVAPRDGGHDLRRRGHGPPPRRAPGAGTPRRARGPGRRRGWRARGPSPRR